MNILLVDDQQIERELVKEALDASGRSFDITEVSNGKDGLSKLSSEQYDVVLLDYRMPKMNGLQTLIQLQTLEVFQRTPVIVISNNHDEDIMLACINAGAQDFLLKDEITSTHLMRCISQSQKRLELESALNKSYQQVKRLAELDHLTGLSNRHFFEQSLNSLLANARGLEGFIAVVLLDLDGFKMINDSLGHYAGDSVLIEFANRVRHRFRESQLFARLGGDEFAFVFTGVKEVNSAFKIADRILASFEEPFDVAGKQIHCSASMGITLNKSTKATVEDLIKQADIAMYKAKSEGKNQACLFEACLEQEFLKAYQIENELKIALKNHAFEMHFQPIYHSQNKKISALEALVRWPSGHTTQVPQEFIGVAERSGLIENLGRWIIQKSIAQFADLRKTIRDQNLHLSINLSPLQIHDLNLPQYILEQLKKYAIAPNRLIVEITETALLENNEATLETIEAIKALECKIALDDFGTGYSSISHLLNYPIDIVKFDRSIVERSLTDKKAWRMLTNLTQMLHDINIDTVAEGVELKDHVQLCKDVGISRLQGYFLGKPLSFSQCKKMLSSKSSVC